MASVGGGAACGALVVLSLFAARKKISASSLTHHRTLSGRIATVQVPFNYESKGKVVLFCSHSNQEIAAITDYPNAFSRGDRVLIIQVRKSYAWVVPTGDFDAS